MKPLFFCVALLLTASISSFAQLSVGYHQSSLPMLAIGYEIKGRLMPELRLATDIDLEEDFSPELVLSYQVLDKSSYEVYAGLGYRANAFQGPLLPLGLNLYPLERKAFGFHLELAPILVVESGLVLRGSWGIRYRFLGNE
ncbi:hypothetical protein [Cesiribacter andamanensis]|uniref:Secreted protein n=1 Tax=Cesiribacter andamanensis AMV16 TaxID=1279009 RepID=M7N1R5_9BACT|nr:hypothetical protein [Cesiribacter andamanensis]EMR02628.1 hypothetical protein ADICEAN_02227 [Cesiribacter andamanensis AMV16]